MNAFTASQRVLNGTYATTGSNIFKGNQVISGSLTVSGSTDIFGTTNVTGSVNVSGSTGTAITANIDTITFTGSFNQSGSVSLTSSVDITGSLTVIDGGITGSLEGTASYALTALTASYLSGSINIDTGSFATTGSNQFSGSQVITGSLEIMDWRLRESGSNLYIEKFDGIDWIQSGYFEI
jgi:hypothetical protein